MINILSYIGVSLQSELCLWTLLGLIRIIFDATLFKVNANLKQVWQMSMPHQLSVPVQQATRTIISGVMLVQCFTVYVYLASYIVLLYPVFLEERPTLVLPWLLLAAIRSFLCELTSLALGLGACVLLGAARPPCIKFVVFKVASIMPAFYMWILVYCYYNMLKVASTYKRFPASLTVMPSDHDYGLELAVRRRRTKSLQDEDQLRKKLVASFNYGERSQSSTKPLKTEVTLRMVHSTHANFEDIQADLNESFVLAPLPADTKNSDLGDYEDWSGSEIIVPRDSDRILEQLSVMMLRIAAWISGEGSEPSKLFSSHSNEKVKQNNEENSSPLRGTDGDASPPLKNIGQSAPYLQNYPQIFNKKSTDRLNKLKLNDSQSTTIDDAEKSNKTVNDYIMPKEKPNVEKERSGEIKKYDNTGLTEQGILEPTAEVKKYTRPQKTESHQQTTLSAINSQIQPVTSNKNKTSPHIVRYDDKQKPHNKSMPPYKDNDSQIMRKKDESEELVASSNHTIQSQTSPTELEIIQERIKYNAALLQDQQRQRQNENTSEEHTDAPEKPSSTRTLKRTSSK